MEDLVDIFWIGLGACDQQAMQNMETTKHGKSGQFTCTGSRQLRTGRGPA